MNADDVLMMYAGQPLESLPRELQEVLQADPNALASFEMQARIAGLMALKRGEIPDPALEGRLIHRVGTRIRNHADLAESRRKFFVAPPAWARMVAVITVMLGLSILTHREMLRSELPDAEADIPQLAVTAGRDLSAEPAPVPVQSLRHVDAFTTLMPQDFNFSQFDFGMQGLLSESLEPPSLQTNRWQNSSSATLPVMLPAP